jgi:hypothetical protein
MWRATAIAGIFLSAGAAWSGELTIRNTSSAPISCAVSGPTAATSIVVPARQARIIRTGTGPDDLAAITQTDCAGLTVRQIQVTADGPGETLSVNGRQRRVLNVALYPYLPTAPGDRFEALTRHVIDTYQQQHPDVLLHAVLNQSVNIYDFQALPAVLGERGFDVVELDTLYLGYLADSGLINPQRIRGERPLPVAREASSYRGALWGIPSWLCMDFIYSTDPALEKVDNLDTLLDYFKTLPNDWPDIVGDFNGSWRLPSLYINAYIQDKGVDHLPDALKTPIDTGIVRNIVALTDTCGRAGPNICTNSTIHGSASGTSEQKFAAGAAANVLGFSEQSFFVRYYGQAAALHVVPVPWGKRRQPLLFSDSFVTSKANCPDMSPCARDAAAFTTLMTGTAMKNFIVQSRDLPSPSPWRTLLVATEAFYRQPAIETNPLYRQFATVFATAKPFPNLFTKAMQAELKSSVCSALKTERPDYAC